MSTRVSRNCLTKLADTLRVSCSRSKKELIPDVVSTRSFSSVHRKTNKISASIAAPLVVKVEWSDGLRVLLHSDWLRDNCQSVRDPFTTQKLSSAADDVPGVIVVDANSPIDSRKELYGDQQTDLVVKWSDNRTSSFDGNWLRSQFPSTKISNQNQNQMTNSFRSQQFDALSIALKATDSIPRCGFDKVMSSDQGAHEWISHLMDVGICVIDQVPTTPGNVVKIASQIAPPMQTLYGETFDVRVEPNPINIAYTNKELGPHMDLPYYESPPGIQLLHCIEFDQNIIGGESVFYDTFVLTQVLKDKDPEAFKTLCEVPATFQKDHLDRELPAQYIYRRPHIQLNHLKEVIAVYWSPAFEGPLILDGELENPEKVAKYYRAYRVFANLMNDLEFQKKWKISFKLKPGEMVSFNQRRLLHARNSFEVPKQEQQLSNHHQGGRWFEGCYVSMDSFLNRFRNLQLNYQNNSFHLGTTSSSDLIGDSSDEGSYGNQKDYANKVIGRGIESAIRVGNGCFH